MAKRISELTPATLPPNPSSLLEVATPNAFSSTGYVSERIPLSSIGGFVWRIFFSGTTTLDEFGGWDFAHISYTELESIAPLSELGSATFDISLSVRSTETGSPRYGSSSSRIIRSPFDYSYMNYLATGGLNSNAAPVTLPYYTPTYSGSGIPPIIANIHDSPGNQELYFTAAIATDPYNTLPPEIIYRGYVDITFTEYIPGT